MRELQTTPRWRDMLRGIFDSTQLVPRGPTSQVVCDGNHEVNKDKLGDGNDNENNGDGHHRFQDREFYLSPVVSTFTEGVCRL